jgi:hypothetical protein
MIDVIVSVVAAGVVADPDSTVHVRGIGMVGPVAEIPALVAVVAMISAVGRRLVVIAVIRRRSA